MKNFLEWNFRKMILSIVQKGMLRLHVPVAKPHTLSRKNFDGVENEHY